MKTCKTLTLFKQNSDYRFENAVRFWHVLDFRLKKSFKFLWVPDSYGVENWFEFFPSDTGFWLTFYGLHGFSSQIQTPFNSVNISNLSGIFEWPFFQVFNLWC